MRFVANRVFWAVLAVFFVWDPVWAGGEKSAMDDTMLMFVGEELSVVTVASRRPESPASAPAIADVVDFSDIETKGYQTLADVLSGQPGFYMSKRARGTVPYLWGIPEGILFLYDGVPMTLDATKSHHPMDQELSMDSIKRVEIVRGPGSVLWGPDAFAGIVNVVPFTGRDRPGLTTRLSVASDGATGAHAGFGHSKEKWDAYLSASASRSKYHVDHFSVQNSLSDSNQEYSGTTNLDPSEYFEVTANAHVGSWLSVSGRVSDFKSRYTMQDAEYLSWAGERSSPVSFFKSSLTKRHGPSNWTLTSYYQNIIYEITDVDLKREQKNQIYYAELLWDLHMFGDDGLLTTGVSYRENDVQGAIVEDGFLPDWLKPDNKIYVPEVEQADYNNRLKSVFIQFRHKWSDLEAWIGGRRDDHSQYRTTYSHSMGLNWNLFHDWRAKLIYGTAYRSPYSRQLFGGTELDPEGVRTISFQTSWNPDVGRLYAFTLFHSQLTDHIQEDPYGGLSAPSDQSVMGVEFSTKARVSDQLSVSAGLTVQNAWGDQEMYQAFKYAYIHTDGTVERFYDAWGESFDMGPSVLAKLGLTWRFVGGSTLSLDASYSGDVPYTFSKNEVSGDFTQPLLLNATFVTKGLLWENDTVKLRVENFLDEDYQVPGLYGPSEGEPFTVTLEWGLRF